MAFKKLVATRDMFGGYDVAGFSKRIWFVVGMTCLAVKNVADFER
jgi:hypothetical protein